jgi:hypothetical protein
MVLVKMKEIAEAYLGKEVKHAVVTVVSYFCKLFDLNIDFSPLTSMMPSARPPRTQEQLPV